MSEAAASLITLIGLLLLGAVVFVAMIIWWFNRFVDQVLDRDNHHIHD